VEVGSIDSARWALEQPEPLGDRNFAGHRGLAGRRRSGFLTFRIRAPDVNDFFNRPSEDRFSEPRPTFPALRVANVGETALSLAGRVQRPSP
jgi:hypothetical protein